MENKIIKCPGCGKEIPIDSVIKYSSGKVRTYWECKDCNLSIMHRG